MRNIILFSIILLTISPIVAQTDNEDLLSEAQKRPFWAVKYNKLCDDYNHLLKMYNKLSSVYQDTLAYYSGKEESIIEQTKALNDTMRSIQPTLDRIALEKESIAKERISIINQKDHYDLVAVRFCDMQLYLPYLKKEVEDAISLYKQISSPKVKKEYGGFEGVGIALENYYRYYVEVRNVIQDAQKDKWRQDTSPLSTFKDEAIAKMKNTEYYRNHYKNKRTMIYFLDGQIDYFFFCLKSQEPGKYDFSYMLEKLFPPAE